MAQKRRKTNSRSTARGRRASAGRRKGARRAITPRGAAPVPVTDEEVIRHEPPEMPGETGREEVI